MEREKSLTFSWEIERFLSFIIFLGGVGGGLEVDIYGVVRWP